MISPAQIRAARGLIGMSADELAHLAGISWATVQRFESAPGIPPSRGGTLERVKVALEQAGVEFLGDPLGSPGVRLRRRD